MNREDVINLIKNKIISEITVENISKLSFYEYQDFVINFFNFVYQYNDKFNLSHSDFRDFMNDFYYKIDLEHDNDKLTNRISLFVEELALNYAYEPYFWNSKFTDFKAKIISVLTPNNY